MTAHPTPEENSKLSIALQRVMWGFSSRAIDANGVDVDLHLIRNPAQTAGA